MDLVHGHGFVALGVPDLEAAVSFYTRVCQLTVTERRDDEVFLTGDDHHPSATQFLDLRGQAFGGSTGSESDPLGERLMLESHSYSILVVVRTNPFRARAGTR